jgi:serine/threonine protein kinase
MSATEGQVSGAIPMTPSSDNDLDVLLPLVREATQGDYEIIRELGRGGMAAVYLATDLSLNRKVAIKTMLPDLIVRPSMVQRFKREAQLAAGLSHPHIIQIHSVKETKRLVYFVMKFIEGRSVESILSERGALDIDTARLILQQAGSALSFAHHRGVIHRDIKPANIMIDENGWAVVTDFGIAKIEDANQLTATGTAIGTPHYMSPEQFHNKPVTGASDQYALGVVAYEMLIGRKPFDGGTVAEIITQQLFKEPPDVRADRADLPAGVAETIIRMLAKEPDKRFPDLDGAVGAFGAPNPAHIDMVRTNLMAIARSAAPQRAPRLSVPLSPIPQTRPSGQATVLTPVPASSELATPRVSPAVPPSSPPSPPQRQPEPSRRGWLWAAAAVVVLAIGGFTAMNFMGNGLASSGSASLDRGVQLYQQGQPGPAEREFMQAAKDMPESALPHVYLSRMAREQGNLEVARIEAGRAARLEPNSVVALREMGSVLLAAGNYDVARRFFVRALRADPSDRASMGWLGCALQRLGQPDQAARWIERAGPGAWAGCLR